MTVRELYNWCKAFRDKDAEVYLVRDWDQCDDNGNFTQLSRLTEVTYQVNVEDMGMDFRDVKEVLMVFEEGIAEPVIKKEGW